MSNVTRFRLREDLEPQCVQVRTRSTAGVEVDVLLTMAQVILLARSVDENPIAASEAIPEWRKL